MSIDEISRSIERQRRAIAARLEAERRARMNWKSQSRFRPGYSRRALPEVQTLEYAGICIQAREVGGDYYDFLSLGPARLGFALADISGKGIAAALIMANLHRTLGRDRSLPA